MKVSDLIEYLQTQPQHLDVIYACCSEYVMLRAEEIKVEEHCEARPDGWVHTKRCDKPERTYLVLPGN